MAERQMPKPEDFPSNANGVVKPDAPAPIRPRERKRRKSSIFADVRDEFISEDAPNVGSYILYDVLLPALRDLILDIAHGSIDMAMGAGGRSYGRRDYGRRNGGSYISYDRYYDDRDERRRRRDRDDYDRRMARRRGERDLTEFDWDYKEQAQDVLDFLCDEIDRHGEVTVARFYDRIGESVPGDFTAEDWGWTNLSRAEVKGSNRKGWYIDFPRVRPLA